MIVGSLKVRLLIREARSLKDKRHVVRSILDRLRNDFRAAAAEVDALDDYRTAVLGFALVGPEKKPIRDTLQRIAEVLRCHPVAEFVSCEFDV